MSPMTSSGPTRTISASIPSVSARATTSGPIPRGSPRVTARRARPVAGLKPDVDVGGAAQLREVVLDGELLTEVLADAVAYVLELQGPRPASLHHVEHHELRTR